MSLSRSLFLCTLRVHRLGVGVGSRGGGGVRRWFTLVSAHLLDLLFQASLSLFEVIVLALERGGRSNQRCDQVFELFDFICEDFDGVEDSVIGCHGCLGVELVLEDGAAFTKVSEGGTGPWVAAAASCFGCCLCVSFHVVVVVVCGGCGGGSGLWVGRHGGVRVW